MRWNYTIASKNSMNTYFHESFFEVFTKFINCKEQKEISLFFFFFLGSQTVEPTSTLPKTYMIGTLAY